MIQIFPRALILLFLLISSPSMSFAQQKCSEIFTFKTAPRVDALQDLRGQLKTKSERQWTKHLDRILKEWDNPYSLTFDIKADAARNGFKPREKIAELFRIFMAKSENAQLATELDRWIQSETQALIAVELMMKAGFKQYETVFDALYSSNLFISDAHPVRGPPSVGSRGLVTFSFEKEGVNPKITEYYRDPRYTKNQWAQLTPDQQIAALKNMPVPHKEFLPPDVVAPNPKKPSFLGGYSREANDGVRNRWGWEIAHKQFEISRHRIMNQVKQIVAFFESHSIHFHIVFELPKKYANFDAFRRWYKHVNDYLYLRGLEEGLHGTEYSSIVNDKRDLSPLLRVRSWFEKSPYKTYLPQRLSDITKFGFKFFSMGLRGGDMYGPPSSKDSVKVGLELRDTTRNVDHLDAYTHQVTEAVTTYRWENINKSDLDQAAVATPRLSNLKNTVLPLLKQVVTDDMAHYLFKIEGGLAVPLIRYDQGQYFNFKTGKFETVSVEKAKELEIARNTYIKALKNLEIEINTMRERGEPIEDQHVQMAIRMSIAEWAALAKASELYEGF